MIYVVEPYLTSSHQHWLELFKTNPSFDTKVFTLPGYHWKWRMHGAAITLAQKISKEPEPDHILISDMCDVAVFKSLLPKGWRCNITLYFHENQLTFPWNPEDKDVKLNRNNHYAFINFTSALAADSVIFNSEFHRKEFLSALPDFLNQFPDEPGENPVSEISKKSSVIPIHLTQLDGQREKWNAPLPTIIWNHRWEYDKNPEEFFRLMKELKEKGLDYNLLILGSAGANYPEIFNQAKELLADNITHFGFVQEANHYKELLTSSHLCVVTSIQDFFGISALEAVMAEAYTLLPNRLAFPEHFNSKGHFYNSYEELKTRMTHYLSNWKNIKDTLATETVQLKAEISKKYGTKNISALWENHFKSDS